MAIVKATPTLEGGHALLELINQWDKSVEVKSISAGIGDGAQSILSSCPLSLPPGGVPLPIDVTSGLLAAVRQQDGEHEVQIRLLLKPEPRTQPAAGSYAVRVHQGKIVEFAPSHR